MTTSTDKIFLVGVLCSVVLAPHWVRAQVVISEIMYDLKTGSDGGREWIEVFNRGSAAIPLTTYKLFENGTAHKITAAAGQSGTLPSGAYAVIADNVVNFKADWPTYTGLLFDSTFSLGNSGDTVALRTASSTDVDTATYQSSAGAAGDGNSLNRAGAGAPFIPRAPSPGLAMSADVITPPPKDPPKAVVKPAKITHSKTATHVISDTTEEKSTIDTSPQDTTATETPNTEPAIPSAPAGNSSLWWLGAVIIGAFACSTLFLAKRLSKTEWDIEEVGG